MYLNRDNLMSLNRMDTAHYGLFSLTTTQAWTYPNINPNTHQTTTCTSWHAHVYNTPPKQPTPHCIADILRRTSVTGHQSSSASDSGCESTPAGREGVEGAGEPTDLRVIRSPRHGAGFHIGGSSSYSGSECSDTSSQHSNCTG